MLGKKMIPVREGILSHQVGGPVILSCRWSPRIGVVGEDTTTGCVVPAELEGGLRGSEFVGDGKSLAH